MRKGILNTDKKTNPEPSQIDKCYLGNSPLSNLRSKLSLKGDKKAVVFEGSGDNSHQTGEKPPGVQQQHSLSKVGIRATPNLQSLPQGYSRSKIFQSLPSEAQLRIEKKLECFLSPAKQKSSLTESRREVGTTKVTSSSFCSTEDTGCFPFKVTPSGNLKVESQQVVFQSKKLSVLVANPDRTRINVYAESSTSNRPAATGEREGTKMAYNFGELNRNSALDAILSQAGISTLGSIIGDTPVRTVNQVSSEYESKQTSEILDPALDLCRLGYTGNDPIDWNKVTLPEKKDLYLELSNKIANKKNTDCKVQIENEEFNCHLIVLQCYSDLFDGYVAVKKVEIPSNKCTPSSFAFIYDWMINEDESYKQLNRNSVLDIFNSAKYLRIKDLVEQCWAFVDNIDVFNEDTAFLLYVDAKTKKAPEVQELMIPRIQEFFLILVSSQDWLDLDVEDVKVFLTSNYIKINCEMEVFMSAVRWLKHDWSNRDQHKLEVLRCVRFGNIAPWQLVDIKRNPENPEFMDLAQDPSICNLIDDGLAFVIIKHWYGQENNDFQHWNSVLGLQEPPPRNWSGLDKTYFRYREFLIYLDQYRRDQVMEKSKSRGVDKKQATSMGGPGMSPDADGKKDGFEKSLSKFGSQTEETFRSQTKEKFRFQTEQQFRSPTEENLIEKQQSIKSILTQDEKEIVEQKKVKQILGEQPSADPEDEKPLDVIYEFDDMAAVSLAKELENEEHNRRREQEAHLFAQQIFTPVRNALARENMNRLSVSALGSKNKDYITETSLFHLHRETVLLFGGVNPHIPYGGHKNSGKDIYRYMPHQNVWEYVGEMPEPRHYHSAQFLKGRIYLAGGTDPRYDDVRGQNVVVDTVWSYEPVKRSWFSEGSLKSNRRNFGLVAMGSCLYALGGKDRNDEVMNSVEYFEIKKGTWFPRASMRLARMGMASARYRDMIWVAGGLTQNNMILDSVEVYNVNDDQWMEITKLNYPRCFCRLIVMNDRLYLVGGAAKSFQKENKVPTSVSCIDIWDISTLKWQTIMDLGIPRHGHAVAYLGTQILIIGGVTTIYMRALANTECLCTKRGTWVRGVALLPIAVSGHAVTTLPPAALIGGEFE